MAVSTAGEGWCRSMGYFVPLWWRKSIRQDWREYRHWMHVGHVAWREARTKSGVESDIKAVVACYADDMAGLYRHSLRLMIGALRDDRKADEGKECRYGGQ